jgi:antibiotic biosynthesis monooxygenase (ABM) superfamily enzyme
MVVTTRVKPGRESEFQAWEDSINAAAARFPGFLGNEVFAPVAGVQEEWVVVVRFDSTEHLEGWRRSDVRQRLVDQAAQLWDEASVETISGGFPGWFASGASTPGVPAFPPEWKQAMIVLLALYPTVMVITYLLAAPRGSHGAGDLRGEHGERRALTWLLMPSSIARSASGWPRARAPDAEVGIGAVLVGYAVLLIALLAQSDDKAHLLALAGSARSRLAPLRRRLKLTLH